MFRKTKRLRRPRQWEPSQPPPSPEPRSYFIPRQGVLERVTAAGRMARRWLRSELELLRRIGVSLKRNQAEPTSTLLEKYSDFDRLELATIARDAKDPIVGEMIDVFDRELGGVRKEIMMSAIDDEAQKIAQEVLESGVAALTDDHPPTDNPAAAEAPTGEPATDEPTIGEAATDEAPTDADDSIAAVESALAAAEADLADAVGILQDASDDVDMVAAACDANAEPKSDGAVASSSDETAAAETPVPETPVLETPAADSAAVDAAAAESATVDAESADPHAEVIPDMQESAPTEPEAPIDSQDQDEAISDSGACPAEGSDVAGDAPGDSVAEVETATGDEQDVADQADETGESPDATEPSDNIECEPVATDQTEAEPEVMEQTDEQVEPAPDAPAMPSPESITSDSVASEDVTPEPTPPEMGMPDVDTVEAASADPSEVQASEVAESAGPAATDASATAVADSAPMQPAATPVAAAPAAEAPAAAASSVAMPDSIASDPTPERANQAVLEIEAGIRKLTALLSNEVSDQWKQASDAMSEVMGAKQSIDESLAQAQAALTELSRVQDEAGIARSEADVARREARLFRQDAELAKQRCDFSAKAAELAADQVAAEAQAAAKMSREVFPQPA